MSSCCQAMYHEENAGDEIISRPAKGKGASLTIRYRLPRSATPISQGPRLVRPRADVVVPQIPLAPEVVDRGHRRLKVAGYDFQLICGVEPLKNPGGTVRQFMPQSRYRNLDNLSLNKYGKGPFCEFRIPDHIQSSGVYVLTVSEHIKYVGECEKFSSRFNMGYGNISPRNCFENGQETNCRINNLVYLAAVARNDILLWFFPTADHKNVEAELRASLRPPWNRVSAIQCYARSP